MMERSTPGKDNWLRLWSRRDSYGTMLCPEDAIEPARSMDDIEAYIRERVRTINEKPHTQIFLPES